MYVKTLKITLLALAGYFVFITCSEPAVTSCTEIGCDGAVGIELTSNEPFADGLVTFQVETNVTNPVTFSCEMQDNKLGDAEDENPLDSEVSIECHPGPNGRGGLVTLRYNDPTALIDAETLGITVRKSDQTIFESVFVGTFVESYPNGEECDENPCISTQVSIDVK